MIARLLNMLPWRRRALEAEAQEELESLRAMAEPGELGNLTLAAEDARAEWGVPWLERIVRDLGIAFRRLRKNPGYSVACILILALGVGANTAMFSVIHAVVLKPLPFPERDRLVFLYGKVASLPWPFGPRMQASRLVYQEWQKQTALFEDVAAYQVAQLNERGVARPRTLETAYASASLLPLLGARATAGRLFQGGEEQKGADQVVVLSDAYFERRFHRNPAAIGQSLTLGRDRYTIIGVLPPRFRVPAIWEGMDQKKPDVWIPLSRLWNKAADDTALQLYVLARRRPSVSLDRARRELNALQQRLNKSDQARFPIQQASVFPAAAEDQSPYVNLALYVLLGAVGMLLLIGCANLANLTLARAARRAHEISIRRALGATRGRIIGELLTESFLLSVAGAAVGVLLAQTIIEGLLRSHAPISRPEDIELNWLVFAFAAGVSLLTTVLFGLAPAVTVSKVGMNEALKSRGRVGGSPSMARSRTLLTIAEVGLAVVLLSGAGTMIRTFVRLVQTGLGFRTERLAIAEIKLPESRYPDATSRERFYADLLPRARAIPGVSIATVSTTLPLKGLNISTFRIAGEPKPESIDKTPSADTAFVGPDYFRLMGLPMLQGREFTAADFDTRGKGGSTVVVNRAFASTFFKGKAAVGQHLLLDEERPSEVIGVVENFLAWGAIDEPHPEYFRPRTDAANALLLSRTAIDSPSLMDDIRATVLAQDPELPLAKVETMDGIIREASSDIQLVVSLVTAFAGIALLLAMVGVYSVLANLVTAQTREFGIRLALGATGGSVAWLVVRQSLTPLGIGLVLGLGGGIAIGRVLQSLSAGVVPVDPLAFVLVTAAVLLVAPMALWGPVRRATSVECTVALREE